MAHQTIVQGEVVVIPDSILRRDRSPRGECSTAEWLSGKTNQGPLRRIVGDSQIISQRSKHELFRVDSVSGSVPSPQPKMISFHAACSRPRRRSIDAAALHASLASASV